MARMCRNPKPSEQSDPMTDIVYSSEPVTLVGAGPVLEKDIVTCLDHAPMLIAVDGGAASCLRFDLVPVAVIGDMDSGGAVSDPRITADNIHQIDEQMSTDFDKALRNIAAPLVLGVGLMGGRVDHLLAGFNVLVRHPNRRCILMSETDLVFLAPPELRLDLPIGARLSLFPMGACEATSDGLRWPVDGLAMAPDGQIGTSNEITGPLRLTVTAPNLLVIVPVDLLELVLPRLLQPASDWPAPGI